MKPKIYIVIPTRNRFEFLQDSIKTCINQDYDNLEIIVSDNASDDETPSIVEIFKDKRITFQRSEKTLPMLYSWEFALSAVKEPGFVHFMGDDNGVTKDTTSRLLDLIEKTKLKIFLSAPIQYTWPSNTVKDGYLSIPKGKKTFVIKSKNMLKAAYNLNVGFDRLPTINQAFIHTSVIDKVKKYFDGNYFIASNPDVCSAVANAMVEDEYVYTQIPFMINGASSKSNGMQGGNLNNKSTFVLENIDGGYKYHPLFPPSKSYYLNVYEAFAKVSEVMKTKNNHHYKLNYKKVYKKFKNIEYNQNKKYWLYDDLVSFGKLINIKEKIKKHDLIDVVVDPTNNSKRIIKNESDKLSFFSNYISLKNISTVSELVNDILGNSKILDSFYYKEGFKKRLKDFIIFSILTKSKIVK